MSYSEEIKQKIKDLYLSSPKIGFTDKTNDIFFFLDKYDFEPNQKEGIGKTVSSISHKSLEGIFNEINDTPSLFNGLGTDFIKQIKKIRDDFGGLYFFENTTSIKITQPTNKEYISTIENKSEHIAKKYGLKECYCVFNSENSEKRNFLDAIIGLNEVEHKLDKIHKLFNIQAPYLVGNNILGIELNFKNKEKKGEYNSCNNKIVLNDKEDIPLIHEYVHFIDKTSTALLLTGKTTQELFEEKKYSAKEIVNIFNMNNFIKLKSNNLWDFFKTRKFNKTFKEEIFQNEQLNKIFNQYNENDSSSYIRDFKNEMFKWIYKQNIRDKEVLCKEAWKIIDGKEFNEAKFEKDNIIHQRVKSLASMFNFYNKNNKENNFMLISKSLDFEKWQVNNRNSLFETEFVTYYQSQKEMLARTIEKYTEKTLNELSNILSTPNFNEETNKDILSIVSSWKNNIDEILSLRQKNEATKRIKDIANNFRKNESHIEKIKAMKI